MEHMAQGTKTSVESVQWERLKCTGMSMDFFNCLIDKGDKEEESKHQGKRESNSVIGRVGGTPALCFSDTFFYEVSFVLSKTP